MLRPSKRQTAACAIAAALAIPAEGIFHYAYFDPPGILSVCYGSTTDVQKGRYYTLDECKARLQADMMASVEAVERCAPGAPGNVLAAFSDAVYNIGPTVACNTAQSTAARMLKAGNYRAACQQLTKWDKARVGGVMVALPGLTKRRAAERDLCLQGLP